MRGLSSGAAYAGAKEKQASIQAQINNDIQPYDSAKFEVALKKYKADKKQEYNNCSTGLGKFFTFFKKKEPILDALIFAVGRYNAEKITKIELLKQIQDAQKLSPGMNEMLSLWYARLDLRENTKQTPLLNEIV